MQVFVQAKLLGIEPFIHSTKGGFAALAGRCLYVSLLMEAIPRAMLERLGLAHELLGSCGGGQFLTVLPAESLGEANAFLVEATRKLASFTGNDLRLAWSSTENLGAWSDIRKRLDAGFRKWRGAAAVEPEGLFEPYEEAGDDSYFEGLFLGLPGTAAAVWDADAAGMLRQEGEPHWLATHFAQMPGGWPASVEELAARARGRKAWGVLRGDADQFQARLQKAETVEEYIQLSVFYKQFFLGEVQTLCGQQEFRDRTTVLYTGGDEFAIAGSWDALLPFAQAIERVFRRSSEELLKDFPGVEGKTLSMGMAVAPSAETEPLAVYREAGRQLEAAKAAGRDSVAVFGKVLDWKQLSEAAELREIMVRMVDRFHCSPQFLGELGAFYRETDRVLPARSARRLLETQQRPWRLHRRLNRVLDGPERNREFEKARQAVLAAFLTRGQGQLKLKPAGRVALEWARMTEEA
ncbi:MAG: hypothetical protein KatS3mg005_1427 [Bryobacteraceae bacterium]|nr:MAG: hypothetical protein KatS3mg005_1427 [Bryobacteraceae bacterium]